jgi:DnaJ-class molecular chaperone
MSLYNILGLEKEASKEEIKKAYRKLALIHHPDRGGNEEEFKNITKAYEILSDDDKRKRYDLTGSETDQPQGGGFNPQDIFNMFSGFNPFNNFKTSKKKLENTTYNMSISLEDSFKGCINNLVISNDLKCDCLTTCDKCKGEGKVTLQIRNGPFLQQLQTDCDKCKGRGVISTFGCSRGCIKGFKKVKENIVVQIPAGVVNGWEITFAEKGKQKVLDNEISGDLVIKINVKDDKNFKRERNNLVYNKTITFRESLLGTIIEIPSFANEEEVLELNEVVSEKDYIIKGKGFKWDNSVGDLVVRVKIDYKIKVLDREDKKVLMQCLDIIGW